MHKNRQQKLTDENLLSDIGLVFVLKYTNISHFLILFFHIMRIMWNVKEKGVIFIAKIIF